MSREGAGHVTVTAKDGVLEIRMPVDAISSLTSEPVAAEENLRTWLPEFGAELAGGFTAQLAEPQRSRAPQRIRIVKIALTRVQVIGETVVELAEPVEVFT